jgi:hypothetical protein
MMSKVIRSLIFIFFFGALGNTGLAFKGTGGFFSGQLIAQNDVTPLSNVPVAQEASSETDDPLAEEDPLSEKPDPLAEEDLLSEESDPLAEEDPLAESEEPFAEQDPLTEEDGDREAAADSESFPIRTSINNRYRLMSGHSEIEKGGIGRENESNKERKNYLANSYQLAARIQTSPYHYYLFRIMSRFSQKYDLESQQYTDDFEFQVREGYFNGISGNHRYTIGAQQFRLGKVDYDSPLDILNPKNITSVEFLDLDESKLPIFGLKYDWLGEIHTFSFYFAPFKQKTAGTEYTLFEEEEEEKETGELPPDRSVTRPYVGLQYQTSLDLVDFRLGLFHWFDSNNDISWQALAEALPEDLNTETTYETDEETVDESATEGDASDTGSSSVGQTYSEKDIGISFASIEMDLTLGSFVLKSDIAIFQDKGFYHFYKDPDNSTTFNTLRVKHAAFAISLEKKLETMFIMPVYSYRLLLDVPADTHILTFENETVPLNKKRDIHKQQLALVLFTEFTETLNTVLTIAQTAPFKQQIFTNFWNWTPGSGKHQFGLKLFHTNTEKLKQTGKRIAVSKGFLEYGFRF